MKITYKTKSGYKSKEFNTKSEINSALEKLKKSKEVIYYWIEK